MAYTTTRMRQTQAGELACRDLSPLARKYYDGTDPLTVLALDDGRFQVEGFINETFKTFDEMQSAFEDMQNNTDFECFLEETFAETPTMVFDVKHDEKGLLCEAIYEYKDGMNYEIGKYADNTFYCECLGGTYTRNHTNEPATYSQALEELGLNCSGLYDGFRYWFAYQYHTEDGDCGSGTLDLFEALDWLKSEIEDGNAEARICVCTEDDDFCHAEINKSYFGY